MDSEVTIEKDGVKFSIDEERIEKVAEFEYEVTHNEIQTADPEKISLWSRIKQKLNLNFDFIRSPYGYITPNVDREANKVSIEFLYNGQTKTEVFDKESQKLANLLEYCGLNHSQLLDLTGEKVPVFNRSHRHKRYTMVPPSNTSFSAILLYNIFLRLCQFNILKGNSSKNSVTPKITLFGASLLFLSQFIITYLTAAYLSIDAASSVLLVILTASLILGIMGGLGIASIIIKFIFTSVQTFLEGGPSKYSPF